MTQRTMTINEDESCKEFLLSNQTDTYIQNCRDLESHTTTQLMSKIALHKIKIEVKRGEFIAIIGEVGSGKSSIISAIIGDMLIVDENTLDKFQNHEVLEVKKGDDKEKILKLNEKIFREFENERKINISDVPPQITISGSISLVEQTPWILNETLRNNILFGEKLNEEKYNETIEICQLARDLEILEGGDLTQIGEKGINLSGGQKARLSIARAVYANKDIVLMDDPLSALDAHVRKNIFDQVLCEKLKNKTRILVTHAVDFLDKVDKILVIEKGQIIHEGTFEEIKEEDYFKIIVQHQKAAEMLEELSQEDEEEKKTRGLKETRIAEQKYKKKSKKSHLSRKGTTIMTDENKEIAKVDIKVYWNYIAFSPVTFILFIVSILSLMVRRFSEMAFDYTLLKWVKNVADTKENDEGLFWLLIGTTFLTTIVTAMSSMIMIWFSMSVSVKMFRKMLNKICHAPINLYYDVTPSGVILNRFSKDINCLDTTIPIQIRAQITNYLVVISALVVTAYNIIWVLAVVPFILIFLIYILKQYSKTLKEASRMESVTSSPILTHLSETINGASTIRAYQKVSDFQKKEYELLDRRVSAMIVKRGVQGWFNTRINLLSIFLMCFTYIY